MLTAQVSGCKNRSTSSGWILKTMVRCGSKPFRVLVNHSSLLTLFPVLERTGELLFFTSFSAKSSQAIRLQARCYAIGCLICYLEYSPSLQSTLKQCLDKRRSLDSVAFDEIWHNLTRALCNLSRVYCVADALDEMSLGNDSFIKKLADLGQLKPASIKVLMTSRPIPRVEKILRKPYDLQITLGQNLVDHDIAVYVEHRLTETGLPEPTRKNIQHSLISKSQGLFLYTKLMMDDLMGSKEVDVSNTPILQDAVDRLPNGLAAMYTKMLQDHPVRSGVPQKLQLIILQWATRSFRPLRLIEVAAMIDSSTKQINLDVGTKALESSRNTKSVIRTACRPLLEILDGEIVSIIQHSFTEYLIDLDRAVTEHNKYSFPQSTSF